MSITTEFPDFPIASIPQLPADWIDSSWHNDENPSFMSNGLQIFLCPDDKFFFVICDAETGETVWMTNSVDECVDFVSSNKEQNQ
jgi:hypothetical protein